MPIRMGQNATISNTANTAVSTLPEKRMLRGWVLEEAGACAGSNWAGVSIVVVILPLAIAAESVVGKHRSEQREAVLLDSLIGIHGASPVGDTGSQHQDQGVGQRRDNA